MHSNAEMKAGHEVSSDAFEAADTLLLGLAVVYLTADEALLAQLEAATAGAGRQKLDDALQSKVFAAAHALLKEGQRDFDRPCSDLPKGFLHRLVSLVVGFQPTSDLEAMLLDQAGFSTNWFNQRPSAFGPSKNSPNAKNFRVAIIGAGMSGLVTAVALKQAGVPFTIFEKSDAIGGTWAVNCYPGCGVDTPSFFYSYSFAPKPDWSRYFVRREEILAYFKQCTEEFGLAQNIKFETIVQKATFDRASQEWVVTVADRSGVTKRQRFNALVTAVGQLNLPAKPNIPGLGDFQGQVVHTAEWHQGIEYLGKRVALLGVGASSMQVGPTIADKVESLTIFQREPHWIMPNRRYLAEVPATEQDLHERFPVYLRWKRLQMIWTYGDVVYPALKVDPSWPNLQHSLNQQSENYRQIMLAHIERELADRPDLLTKTKPDFPPYGKRVLLDNNWYKMLKRPNVNLVTSGVESIGPTSIRTANGHEHSVDVIVLATGFQASRMLWPMDFENGLGESLRNLWRDDDPRAYLGITIPEFPNLFLTYGPNTNLGFGGSAISNAECQARYITGCIELLVENGWGSLECKRHIHDAYNRVVDEMHEEMVWARDNVNNWFRNKSGRVTANMPWSMLDYWKLTQAPNLEDFIVRSRQGAEIPVGPIGASILPPVPV